jgi:hypothetical protein
MRPQQEENHNIDVSLDELVSHEHNLSLRRTARKHYVKQHHQAILFLSIVALMTLFLFIRGAISITAYLIKG